MFHCCTAAHWSCRVPLPAWALPLMLLPASALLLTLGVALLGACAYALLQLLRRLRTLSFCHNDAIAIERWPAEYLAIALCAFPAYLVGVFLFGMGHFSIGVSVGAGFACGCILACIGVVLLNHMLSREDEQVNMARDHSILLSIPESGVEAPLMRAFLHDSIVHADQEIWRDPSVDGRDPYR
jgi:hypothetical protein